MPFNKSILSEIVEKELHAAPFSIEKLPQSGSNRQYYRIIFQKKSSIIGVYNEDIKENEAFFSFTHFFKSQNVPVPEIYAISENRMYYLLQDLGDETLYSYLTRTRNNEEWNENLTTTYKQVIDLLPTIQWSGKNGIDFSKCYPRSAFDRQSMQWDLNYFKYYFLKLANISFDEQQLEDDFNRLINYLLEEDTQYFLFRDFQSRNIMIFDNKIYFIDYQGGRKGALEYDIASLLYDGKANIPPQVREELFAYYLDKVQEKSAINRENFTLHYNAFVLIRILQAMGTYGYRGYYEKKSHFLLSIPYAINNIKYLLKHAQILNSLSTLREVLVRIVESNFASTTHIEKEKLTVSVYSFSYKKGIPQDYTANGGGFVFDCRALPNPGRYEAYRDKTGKDIEVIEFLENHSEIIQYQQHVEALVFGAVNNYIERNFSHLMVCFGCTGGQHRSVYFAQKLAETLKRRYPQICVKLTHREQE